MSKDKTDFVSSPCSRYRHSLIHLSVVERARESNRLTLTTTHLLIASTLGPWCASYCSIRERTFRTGLRSLCRVLAKRIFVGETVGRACPLTQLVCCARDPSCTDAEDAYDADADKAMFLRCAVFGTLCLPIFALIDVGMTVLSCFRPSSYSGCFRSLR